MEFALIEFKLYVKAFFNSNLHLDWFIIIRLFLGVRNYELLLFCYSIVISIDYHIYIVSQPNHYSAVAFELFFHSVELEIVWNIVSECSGGFQVSNDLQKCWILIFVY